MTTTPTPHAIAPALHDLPLDLLDQVSGGDDDRPPPQPSDPDTSCDADTCISTDGGAEYWSDW